MVICCQVEGSVAVRPTICLIYWALITFLFVSHLAAWPIMASTSNCHMQITRVEMSAMKYQRRLNVFGTVRPLKVTVKTLVRRVQSWELELFYVPIECLTTTKNYFWFVLLSGVISFDALLDATLIWDLRNLNPFGGRWESYHRPRLQNVLHCYKKKCSREAYTKETIAIWTEFCNIRFHYLHIYQE